MHSTLGQWIESIALSRIGAIQSNDSMIDESDRLSKPGRSFKVAMQTLHVFRTSVGAAALCLTQTAQRVIDRRAQIHGGLGVKLGHPGQSLYRETKRHQTLGGTG